MIQYHHPHFGRVEYTGQAWFGHANTLYGTFRDSTGQSVNLPIREVSATLHEQVGTALLTKGA